MSNRLARERRPNILHHPETPVDWYPWGDEAFEKARREEKPIFLSIGYSTCHWCHVMEHESFEDPAIAAVLNRDFVAIKVDREERPDIDRVYMTFVQATTGAGGWPMSVWLTPDRQPFFGGTYFPPESRWGRPGFIDVLGKLVEAWRTDRARVMTGAKDVTEKLRAATGADGAAADRAPVAGRNAIDLGVKAFAEAFDAPRGGFGGAPKFPRPSELRFLLDAYALTGNDDAKKMALGTLRAMAMGGMRDHIGGGFHRYSVDAEWRVPHFEKMLYDQAQLIVSYLDAAQASEDPFYAAVAEDTLAYVVRDLTGAEGGFLSAEDADSMTFDQPAGAHQEKREGAFYVWTSAELDALFGDDASIVKRRFGVAPNGNALADPQGEFHGQNILYVDQSIEEIAVRTGRDIEEVMRVLTKARRVMFDVRAHRPKPHLDDKVITAWNGLMIGACARAARVLVDSPNRDRWRTAAISAAEAVHRLLWQPERERLLRRYRDGEAAIDGFCEDYACLIAGLLELFQATGDARWLEWATQLQQIATSLFHDTRDGGWFNSAGDDPSVLLRLKEDYDGAEPSAASITVRNLIGLGRLTGDASFGELAQRALERYGTELGRVARVMPFMLANIAFWHAPTVEIVIAGDATSADRHALERVVAAHFLPFAVHVPVTSEMSERLATRLPWMAAIKASDGRATAYVCQDYACQLPVTEPDALERQLPRPASSRIIL